MWQATLPQYSLTYIFSFLLDTSTCYIVSFGYFYEDVLPDLFFSFPYFYWDVLPNIIFSFGSFYEDILWTCFFSVLLWGLRMVIQMYSLILDIFTTLPKHTFLFWIVLWRCSPEYIFNLLNMDILPNIFPQISSISTSILPMRKSLVKFSV